ncbi:class I SAM-dependent methyltransferase [Candidimonas sp. SYP-B2681]|nr:SAM-dependent methyltransferase [Candidimonas sp. SYP-B2681]RTZ45862.1 class I SAM-dependent methyltransferase [Candidimonas sp. SYP-B2681]
MHPSSIIPSGLPALDADSSAHAQAVSHYLMQQIRASDIDFIPFDTWMDMALYAPGLGYYSAGNTKFGSHLPTGDFTTAPELTPLYGRTLARQVAQVLTESESVTVLEFGAGSGALAAAIIPALRQMGIEPVYQILEVSADLRARQQQGLASLGANISWLTEFPVEFSGCVVANEVLDAMPVTLFRWNDDGELMELGVRLAQASQNHAVAVEAADGTNAPLPSFEFAERRADPALQGLVSQRMPPLPGYQSEINRQAEAWMTQMGSWLKRGAALLMDYGFPQREYYHPQRHEGTLMCHFRHHAHSQPLIYAGLQDITSHVDFTAMADAALSGGLQVLGYTSQARFLINAGLPDLLTQTDAVTNPQTMSAVQKLLSEAEMGELFKVLAVGRGVDQALMGFNRGDRRDRL